MNKFKKWCQKHDTLLIAIGIALSVLLMLLFTHLPKPSNETTQPVQTSSKVASKSSFDTIKYQDYLQKYNYNLLYFEDFATSGDGYAYDLKNGLINLNYINQVRWFGFYVTLSNLMTIGESYTLVADTLPSGSALLIRINYIDSSYTDYTIYSDSNEYYKNFVYSPDMSKVVADVVFSWQLVAEGSYTANVSILPMLLKGTYNETNMPLFQPNLKYIYDSGYDNGYADGNDIGYDNGYADGYDKGANDGVDSIVSNYNPLYDGSSQLVDIAGGQSSALAETRYSDGWNDNFTLLDLYKSAIWNNEFDLSLTESISLRYYFVSTSSDLNLNIVNNTDYDMVISVAYSNGLIDDFVLGRQSVLNLNDGILNSNFVINGLFIDGTIEKLNGCYIQFNSIQYNDGYISGFNEGKKQGYDNGYADGNNIGYDNGYADGYDKGAESGNVLGSSLLSIADIPFIIVSNFLGFEILGFNLLTLFTGLLTIGLVIYLLKKFF